MKELTIHVSNAKYKIYIGNGIINQIDKYLKELAFNNKIFIITDKNIEKLYLDDLKQFLKNYEVYTVVIKSGEIYKNLKVYESIIHELLAKQITKQDLIIAFGGGVIGDISGFVAATLHRGIPYIQIPTTIIAQVDSSIGGKTAINNSYGKNMIGAFYHPKLVLIDINFLNTLPKRQFYNGFGEIIKCACIGNKSLFSLLDLKISEELIYGCLVIKKNFVELDEFDNKERMILNFGHTYGHILEKKGQYKHLLHGEAVALGMLLAIKLGIYLKVTPPNLYQELSAILSKYNLPVKDYLLNNFSNEILFDKKNRGKMIHFILLRDFGDAIIKPIPIEDLERILKEDDCKN